MSCAVSGGLRQEIADEVMAAAQQLQEQHAADVPGLTAPAAVVPCSAVTGGQLAQHMKTQLIFLIEAMAATSVC